MTITRKLAVLGVALAALLFAACNPPTGSDSGYDPEGAAALVVSGEAKVSSLDFEGALNDFSAAVLKDPENENAKIWVSMLSVMQGLISDEMVDLMKNRFGFVDYPSTISEVLSDSWLVEYHADYSTTSYDEDLEDNVVQWHIGSAVLPRIQLLLNPADYPNLRSKLNVDEQGFLVQPTTGDEGADETMMNYMGVLAANAFVSSPEGLNAVIDGALAVVNSQTNLDSVSHIETLTDFSVGIDAGATLSALWANYEDSTGLPYEDTVLPAVNFPNSVPLTTIVKGVASLSEFWRGFANFFGSYNWNLNVNDWIATNGDSILSAITDWEENEFAATASTEAALILVLQNVPNPFTGDFMNDRSQATRDVAKAAFVSSLNLAHSAADSFFADFEALFGPVYQAVYDDAIDTQPEVQTWEEFSAQFAEVPGQIQAQISAILNSLNGVSPYEAEFVVSVGYDESNNEIVENANLSVDFSEFFDSAYFAPEHWMSKNEDGELALYVLERTDNDSSYTYEYIDTFEEYLGPATEGTDTILATAYDWNHVWSPFVGSDAAMEDWFDEAFTIKFENDETKYFPAFNVDSWQATAAQFGLEGQTIQDLAALLRGTWTAPQ